VRSSLRAFLFTAVGRGEGGSTYLDTIGATAVCNVSYSASPSTVHPSFPPPPHPLSIATEIIPALSPAGEVKSHDNPIFSPSSPPLRPEKRITALLFDPLSGRRGNVGSDKHEWHRWGFLGGGVSAAQTNRVLLSHYHSPPVTVACLRCCLRSPIPTAGGGGEHHADVNAFFIQQECNASASTTSARHLGFFLFGRLGWAGGRPSVNQPSGLNGVEAAMKPEVAEPNVRDCRVLGFHLDVIGSIPVA